VPALCDCILRVFRQLRSCEADAADADKETVFLVRTDGMGKQKNLAWRVLLTLEGMHPNLISNVEHAEDTGKTTALVHTTDGGQRRVALVVCWPLMLCSWHRNMNLITQYAVCNWHRNMTLIKSVLRTLNDPEKIWAMQDHCSIMHRLDRAHEEYYIVIKNEVGDDEMTITEYLASEAGQWWFDSPREVQAVQYWVRWTTLLRMANLTNQRRIQEMPLLREGDEKMLEPLLDRVRHALCHINAYQVRIFVAFLYEMCTLDEIKQAGQWLGQKYYHKFLSAEKKMAYAKPFKMKLCYFDAAQMNTPQCTKEAWCWPCFAPPSAMQFLMPRLKLTAEQCQWVNHCRAGVQCFEAAMGEKVSWWNFWAGAERYCPLEQRATKAQVTAAHKARAERGVAI
jgi:hypothetical protein